MVDIVVSGSAFGNSHLPVWILVGVSVRFAISFGVERSLVAYTNQRYHNHFKLWLISI